MELDILQQQDMIGNMAQKQIETLLKDMNAAFKTLSEKNNLPQKDIQLAIRYDSKRLNDFIVKRIGETATYFGIDPADAQLAIGFAEIENGGGDCKFVYKLMKQWRPVEEKIWLDDLRKTALESFLTKKLNAEDYQIKHWTQVSLVFHIQGEKLKMSVYTKEDGIPPQHKKSFVFADEVIKNAFFIYFQVMTDWKVFRNANFSKDFLNADTIMKDEREDLVRIYLAGGAVDIPGMDPIEVPGNYDVVAEKYGIGWNDIAFVFFKETDESMPQLGIYEVKTDGTMERKEIVDIFSLAPPADELPEDKTTTT